MIGLVRPSEPPGFATVVQSAQDEIADRIKNGKNPRNDDFTNTWKQYKHIFGNDHGRKCAYCETRFGGGYPGDVEHYRPKAEIKDAKSSGNRDDRNGQRPGRKWKPGLKPGYWWLAYVWDNYLLSCKKCNTWKANQFPVKGRRPKQLVEGIEKKEKTLLLNPYNHNPASHFKFDETGGVKGLTPEGKKTIDVCGLDRRTLEIERERVAQEIIKKIDDYALACAAKSQKWQDACLRDLLRACRDEAPYAGMARDLVRQKFNLSYQDLVDCELSGLL